MNFQNWKAVNIFQRTDKDQPFQFPLILKKKFERKTNPCSIVVLVIEILTLHQMGREKYKLKSKEHLILIFWQK